jgi:hypothetical protein
LPEEHRLMHLRSRAVVVGGGFAAAPAPEGCNAKDRRNHQADRFEPRSVQESSHGVLPSLSITEPLAG